MYSSLIFDSLAIRHIFSIVQFRHHPLQSLFEHDKWDFHRGYEPRFVVLQTIDHSLTKWRFYPPPIHIRPKIRFKLLRFILAILTLIH
jgi:hypothetical protein